MAIYDFFLSRNSSANAASYIGHAGRLFYDSNNGIIKLSDGVTVGGTFIPYNIATPTTIGGIKAGPGANVAADGTLTIDTTGLPLGIGNLAFNDTTISAVNANNDVVLASNGTGNVELVGNIRFYSTAQGHTGSPFFTADGDGQITLYTPAGDPSGGAVKIIGSLSGRYVAPVNTGVMLQLTGNNNDASRLYNDAVGGWAAFVGRRINGTVASPTSVQAGDEIIRISSTGYDGNSVPGTGTARIVFQAKENYTTSAKGSNVSIWATAPTTTTLSKVATFDAETGVTATNVVATGTVITTRIVIASTGIRSIQDGVWANLSFATDSIVHLYQPSGDVTVNLSGFTLGATVRLFVNFASAHNINLGVYANNSTNGSTTLSAAKVNNNQAVQIVYTCIDGTYANTHAVLSYA